MNQKALLFIFGIAMATPGISQSLKTYANDNFSFSYPASWDKPEEKNDGKTMDLGFVTKTNPVYAFTISILSNKTRKPVEKFVQEMRVADHADSASVSFGNIHAYKLTSYKVQSDGTNNKEVAYLFHYQESNTEYGTAICMISYIGKAADVGTFEHICEDAVRSFRFKPKTADVLTAIKQVDVDKLKSLIFDGVNVNLFNSDHLNHDFPLILAVSKRKFKNEAEMEKSLEIIQLLLDNGADPNKMRKLDGKNALHVATQVNSTDSISPVQITFRNKAVEMLLNKGASPNTPDECNDPKGGVGQTPLWYAVSAVNPVQVKLLLAKGADKTKECNCWGYKFDPLSTSKDQVSKKYLKLHPESAEDAKKVLELLK